jgi:hypothetical protein
MLDDKHEVFRYMNGRKSIETKMAKVPQDRQASFVYECLSYMSDYPTTPVPVVVETVFNLWQKYDRL